MAFPYRGPRGDGGMDGGMAVVGRRAAVVTAFQNAESQPGNRGGAIVKRHAAKTIIEHAAVVGRINVPQAGLRPFAEMVQVVQDPPGHAAFAMQQEGQRLVKRARCTTA